VLPELVGDIAAARRLKPRGRPKSGNARLAISPHLLGQLGEAGAHLVHRDDVVALETHRSIRQFIR
jgi:hypothetical protein